MSSATICVFLVGLGIVAISVLGNDPGFGVLALYVVYAMNISFLPFFTRVVTTTVLVVLYLAAIMSFNRSESKGGVTTTDFLTHGAYLLIFLVGIVRAVQAFRLVLCTLRVAIPLISLPPLSFAGFPRVCKGSKSAPVVSAPAQAVVAEGQASN